MVEPGGAMAMFVLRLAGLLSLENALQEQDANFTNASYNLKHHYFNQSMYPINHTWTGTDILTSNNQSLLLNETSFPLNPQDTSLSTLGSTEPSTTGSTSPSPSIISTTSLPTIPHPSTQSRRTPIPPINVKNRNLQKSNERIQNPNPSKRKISNGQTSTSQVAFTSSTEEIPVISDDQRSEEIHEFIVRESEIRSHSMEQIGHDIIQSPATLTKSLRRGMPLEGFLSAKELYPESFSPITPLPAPITPLPVTAGFPKSSESTSELYPESFSPFTPLPEIDNIMEEESPTSISTFDSTSDTNPTLEMMAEDDDQLLALIDQVRFRSLEAPPEDFVESDFEYYDFNNQQEEWQTEAPTLSSLNLVSAVPVGKFPSASIPAEPIQIEYTDEVRQPQPSTPKKLPPARPIPPNYRGGSGMRNNPYPYGPKLLPGPYAPLTPNLPSATEDDHQDRHIPAEYSYEYEDIDYYYDPETGDSGYEVQTKEPPVLFVFDKPGYVPEAPTTLPPATRNPTPSDPWDCAPRCPRYTLLDWNTDYDVRQYPKTSWISTVIISDNRVLAELEGYMKVQDYFYGLNDRGMVLNLTIPFVTQIKFGKHPGVLQEMNDYTISLYIQPSYTQEGEELPTPISNEVLVDELEQKTVFVHSFEANVWDVTGDFLEGKVEMLMSQLRHNGEAFLDRYYYLASYSRPELYQPVYYEVWIYATNFRDPQTSSTPLGVRRLPQTNKVTQKSMSKLCRGVECPSFEVLRTYKYGIQKRRYYNGMFASTSPNECQFTTMSVWKGFMPLHLYKHGINSHMEVIEATRPIALVNIRDSSDPSTECPQNMTMSIYLPKRLHSNPPITGYAAPDVHITTMNDVIVYAYTVGGYLLNPKRVRKELADLKYRLSEFGACYKDDEYYVVIYDFIVRYHGRQNEIWIVAENCKATHNG